MEKILEVLPLAGIGAGMALLTSWGKTGRFRLPRIVRQLDDDGSTVTLVDLGFLGSWILGGVAAMLGAGGWRSALVWGAIAGFVGPAVLNLLLDPLLHRLGLPEAGSTNMDEEGKS